MSFQRARQKCLDSNFNSGLEAVLLLTQKQPVTLASLAHENGEVARPAWGDLLGLARQTCVVEI